MNINEIIMGLLTAGLGGLASGAWWSVRRLMRMATDVDRAFDKIRLIERLLTAQTKKDYLCPHCSQKLPSESSAD